MGMDVIVHTATEKTTPEQRADRGYIVPGIGDPDGSVPSRWFSGSDKASLHAFLAQDIDILVVSVPLTCASDFHQTPLTQRRPTTRQMLSTAEFDILAKHPPIVSNIARGPIIDTAALVAALKDGKVRGAALDVTDPEPLNADSELWDMPNVVITPHVSGGSTEYVKRAFAVLEANLYRLEKGEKGFINEISRHKGY
jgi:phosphoglycerate dehydrogenase-like enzyme